jgi:tetratricopeptide (TPR) repeat protein
LITFSVSAQGTMEQEIEGALDNDKAEKIDPERNFIDGMRFFVNEDFDKALTFFEKTLKKSKDKGAVLHQMALCYQKMGDNKKALDFSLRAFETNNKNRHFGLNLAHSYLNIGDGTNYEKTLLAMTKANPRELEFYIELFMFYVDRNNYTSAIDILNAYEKQVGFEIEIVRRKQMIYREQRQLKMALKEGEKIIERFPYTEDVVVPQAELLIIDNQENEAEKILLKYLKHTDESRVSANFYLAQIYEKRGNQERYFQVLGEIFSEQDAEVAPKINMLIQMLDEAQRNETKLKFAKSLAEKALQVHPDSPELCGVYGDLLLFSNETEKAGFYYEKAVKEQPDNLSIWVRLIQIDFNLDKNQDAENHLESAMELFPNAGVLWQMSATLEHLKKNYDEAVSALNRAKNLTDQFDSNILSDIEAHLGDIYHDLKNFSKSDKAYEKAIELNSENIRALNNYAYYLSVRKENLEIALKLSTKLVKLAPDEPTYLDTHGWVLFVKGNYQEAFKFLSRAAEKSVSSTIIEHYGDVLFKLGKLSEALEQWKKAKSLGAGGLIDKKISEEKYSE